MIAAVFAFSLMPLVPFAIHDVHVSTGRLAVDGRTAVARVTVFRNDFEHALREATKRPAFVLEASAAADSAVVAYLQKHFVVQGDGKVLTPRLIGSGEEKGLKRELDTWYYDLRFDAAQPIRSLTIQNDVLFELFHDQRNILKIRLPSGTEKTIFFVPDESTYTLAPIR